MFMPVDHHIPKLNVAGSIPVSRSRRMHNLKNLRIPRPSYNIIDRSLKVEYWRNRQCS
jgi:hypothetical protein